MARTSLTGNGEYMKCSICKQEIYTDRGHNAEPVAKGECCEMCNQTRVIPERLKQISTLNIITD